MHTQRFAVRSLSVGAIASTLLWLTPSLAKGRTKTPSAPAPSAKSEPKTPPAAPKEEAPLESEPLESPSDGAEVPANAEAALPPSGDPPSSAALPCAPIAPSNAKNTVWLDGGIRWDTGNFSRTEQIGGNRQHTDDPVDSWGPMFHLGYLWRATPSIAIGGAFGYGGNYDLNNDDLLIGQLLTLEYVTEFSAPLSSKFSIVGTPRIGASIVIPGGILAERIDENQQAGYSTWSGPRYGFMVGFEAGVKYKLTPWLSARLMVGYSWNLLFLLDSQADGQTVSASQNWQVQTSRVSSALGLEVNF